MGIIPAKPINNSSTTKAYVQSNQTLNIIPMQSNPTLKVSDIYTHQLSINVNGTTYSITAYNFSPQACSIRAQGGRYSIWGAASSSYSKEEFFFAYHGYSGIEGNKLKTYNLIYTNAGSGCFGYVLYVLDLSNNSITYIPLTSTSTLIDTVTER